MILCCGLVLCLSEFRGVLLHCFQGLSYLYTHSAKDTSHQRTHQHTVCRAFQSVRALQMTRRTGGVGLWTPYDTARQRTTP